MKQHLMIGPPAWDGRYEYPYFVKQEGKVVHSGVIIGKPYQPALPEEWARGWRCPGVDGVPQPLAGQTVWHGLIWEREADDSNLG